MAHLARMQYLRLWRKPEIGVEPAFGEKFQRLQRGVVDEGQVFLSPLRTDSLPLVSKIYWPENADDAIMDAP